MKPPAARASHPSPDPSPTQQLITLLEVIASERPEALPVLLTLSENSPLLFALQPLAREWGIQVQDLLRVALKSALQLDRLESPRRSPKLTDRWIASQPHLEVLFHFAAERRERLKDPARRRRLTKIRTRLEAGLETARQRRRIQEFIGVSTRPASEADDPHWVEMFIGR